MCEEIETETPIEMSRKPFAVLFKVHCCIYTSCIVSIKTGQEVDFKHTDGRTASTANKQLARA